MSGYSDSNRGPLAPKASTLNRTAPYPDYNFDQFKLKYIFKKNIKSSLNIVYQKEQKKFIKINI